MSALLILATLQTAAYGVVGSQPNSESAAASAPKGRCPEASSNEIVVCKRQDSPQPRIGPLNEPAKTGALIFDDNGKFRLDLEKGVLLHGGGAKGSVGVGLNIAF
jgi:hypothetical protein